MGLCLQPLPSLRLASKGSNPTLAHSMRGHSTFTQSLRAAPAVRQFVIVTGAFMTVQQ